jgi:hypothetical protein
MSGFRAVGPRPGYNILMLAAGPKRQPDASPPERHGKPHIYSLEATGLLISALLILILTLIRYWGHIPWGAR